MHTACNKGRGVQVCAQQRVLCGTAHVYVALWLLRVYATMGIALVKLDDVVCWLAQKPCLTVFHTRASGAPPHSFEGHPAVLARLTLPQARLEAAMANTHQASLKGATSMVPLHIFVAFCSDEGCSDE